MADLALAPARSTIPSRADALDRTASTTRRENMRTLVPQADELVSAADQEIEDAYRALTTAESAPNRPNLGPLRERLAEAQTIAERVRQLRGQIRNESEDVEVRYSFNSGICGVYNQATGRVQWESEAQGGITGIYNAATRRIDWFRAPNQGVAAVRDPRNGRVDVRRNANGGIAGVVDPATNAPHFVSGRGGVGMIVDPATRRIETRQVANSPVVGYINPATGRFDFQSAQTDGMAIVYRDGKTYRSSCSFVPSPQLPRPDPFPPLPPIPPIPIPPR